MDNQIILRAATCRIKLDSTAALIIKDMIPTYLDMIGVSRTIERVVILCSTGSGIVNGVTEKLHITCYVEMHACRQSSTIRATEIAPDDSPVLVVDVLQRRVGSANRQIGEHHAVETIAVNIRITDPVLLAIRASDRDSGTRV